jgi:HD-like signal output (HDOD) protein
MQQDLFSRASTSFDSSSLLAGPPVLALEDPFPRIPTMIATRLQLELLLQDYPIDLSAVSEVILSDAGATLEILRLIGEEYFEEEGRPTRIEDCLVSLNKERWYEAVCTSIEPQNGHVSAEWQHCRRVARCARELSKCIDGFSPEEAYVIGLLHELGRFPHLLGWNSTGDTSGEHQALGVMLADYWHLPSYLSTAIREQQESPSISRWSEILELARQVAYQAETVSTE